MQYLKIQNNGEIPVHGIRLLGHTTKAADKIGRFGTGLKEAVTLLIRLGAPPIIYTGTTRIDFTIEIQDGVKEVHMKLSAPMGEWEAEKWYGLGVSPDFGKLDWTDLWQALREIYCNAYDEESDFAYVLGELEPRGVEGETRVFVPAGPEMIKEHELIERRLLFTKPPCVVFTDPQHCGRLLAKDDALGEGVHIFHKQVWVQSGPREDSLYNYELQGIRLNESRSSDWYSCTYEAGKLIVKSPVPVIKTYIMAMADKKKQSTLWERNFSASPMVRTLRVELPDGLPTPQGRENNWKKAWHQLYGSKGVICLDDSWYFMKMMKKGYTPVVIHSDACIEVLKAAGVPTWREILTEDEQKYQEIIQEELPLAHQVWDRLTHNGFTGHVAFPQTFVFTEEPRPDCNKQLGYAQDGGIYINADIIGAPLERVVVLEELVHHITDAADRSDQLEEWLFGKMDELLWK